MGKVFIPNLCRCNLMNQKYFLFYSIYISRKPNGFFISRNIQSYTYVSIMRNVKISILIVVLIVVVISWRQQSQSCSVYWWLSAVFCVGGLSAPSWWRISFHISPGSDLVRPGDGTDINYTPTDLRPPSHHRPAPSSHIERFWIFLTSSVLTSVLTRNSQHWLTKVRRNRFDTFKEINKKSMGQALVILKTWDEQHLMPQ